MLVSLFSMYIVLANISDSIWINYFLMTIIGFLIGNLSNKAERAAQVAI